MKKKLIAFLFACMMLASLAAQKAIQPVGQSISEGMTSSVEKFKEGNASEGALLLLDVVTMTRPDDSWPDGFMDRIDTAQQAFKANDLVCGVAEVKRALDIIKPNQPVPAPSDDDQISNLAEALLGKIQSGAAFFKQGLADQAVVCILEALLLLSPRS